ncbi:MAG: hypothetical protein K2H60_00075 [Muribaculaceae bacterium]|nr:hypothetical protein [Muribaculaceae bacterium]
MGRSNSSVERLRLTDFDSQGNWRKASYYFDNKKTPIVTRTLSYTHSPEHIALLEKSKELYQEVEDHKTNDSHDKFLLLGLSIPGLLITLLCLRAKNLFSGKFRWIMVLIIGLQSVTMFWFSVTLLIPAQPAWYQKVFSLVFMIAYIVLMELAMKSMVYDRRLSNGFITFFLVIWSLWAELLLCPTTLAALIPSIGAILGYILGLVLAGFYYRYLINRCPRCRNPFGLQYHHRSMEGLKTVTRTTQSTKYRDEHPQVLGLSQSGTYTHATLGVKGTRTTTTNTNVYETYRDHHKCWECGYMTTSSLMRGKLVDSDSSTSTDSTKDIVDVHHW